MSELSADPATEAPAPAAPVSFDAVYVRAEDQVHAVEIDGETVVYSVPTQSLHLLDGTATVIWSSLSAGVTLGGLCDELAEAYGADPAVVRGDVQTLIERLTAAGVVRATDG